LSLIQRLHSTTTDRSQVGVLVDDVRVYMLYTARLG
jgi:hypothetical protein